MYTVLPNGQIISTFLAMKKGTEFIPAPYSFSSVRKISNNYIVEIKSGVIYQVGEHFKTTYFLYM